MIHIIIVQGIQEKVVQAKIIGGCAMGRDGMVGEFDDDIEEGIPYITGNILWAVYQFITFIVMNSTRVFFGRTDNQ